MNRLISGRGADPCGRIATDLLHLQKFVSIPRPPQPRSIRDASFASFSCNGTEDHVPTPQIPFVLCQVVCRNVTPLQNWEDFIGTINKIAVSVRPDEVHGPVVRHDVSQYPMGDQRIDVCIGHPPI